jgi:hypothetical protein
VLSVGYDACVAEFTNTQLALVTRFDENFHIEQAAVDNACKTRKQTEERLTKTFQVIVCYIQTLDKLSSGGAATFDKSITTIAGEVPGLNSTQQTAITGLATLVADAFEKHWRERHVAKAIELAEPHMLVLTKMFDEQLPPFLEAMLRNERDSLGSLYRDIAAARNGAPPISPILITSLYSGKMVAIDKSREGIEAFQKAVAAIQTGHTALYKNRNKLHELAVIEEVLQTAAAVQTQVAAMQAAF